jgi:hypothetical protein
MPIRFAYDESVNALFTKAEGLVSFEDINRHLDEESRAGGLAFREIVDATDAQTNLTLDQTREIVARLSNLKKTHSLGATAVVTRNDVVFGMATMIAILSDLQGGPKVQVFRRLDEGMQWLLHTAPNGYGH